ncbi:MAG: amidohydrolase, partial [Anaerolineae bacterium]|nr:amidohydrolase [Anaerolineae bacterium]
LDDQGTILRDTDLLIEGDRITKIGDVPAATKADEIIDAAGKIAMPGFFNAHCHSPMTFERGWAEDLPFPRWLNEKIWVAESALTPDDVYWGAALAACEMIRCGTVGYNDHYFYMDRVAELVEQSGQKAMLAWCTFGIGDDKEIGPGEDEQIAFSQQYHNAANGRIHTCLGPHSPYVCPPEFLERIVDEAGKHNLPIHLHVSESLPQVENSREKYGKTPVEHLNDLGVFDHPTIAAHSLALYGDDFAIMAEKGVFIPRTPITYMKLAMPIRTPITALQEAGITRIALGSDGPASNADMDMFAIIRQQVLIEKYEQENPEALPGDTALRMATQTGAQALGFAESGVLAEGRPADLILVDFNRPHLRPRHDLIANLVHSAKGADVTHTIVNGQLLMRDRELLTLDEEKILYEAEKHAFRMVGQDMKQMREYNA